MGNCVVECGEQSVVLRVVVGLMAKIFTERGDLAAGLISDNHAIPRRSGVAAGPAIDVCDEIRLGRSLGRKKTSRGCTGFLTKERMRRHSGSVHGPGQVSGLRSQVGGAVQRPAASRVASRWGRL